MDVVFPLIYMFLLGLCVGSFLNVVIVRLPKGESLIRPGSHCIHCGQPLALRDKFPLLSYAALRGRCRFCNEPISLRYPLVEALTACLFTLCALRFGIGVSLIAACSLCALLIVCAFIDYIHRLVYDSALIIGVLPAILIKLLLFALSPTPSSAADIAFDMVAGIAAGALPLLLIAVIGKLLAKKPVMGGGDIKLMAVAGLYLGWQGALLALAFASIGGGLLLFVLLLARKVSRDQEIPFVPMLAFGAALSLLAGEAILHGYLSLFGIV